MQSLPRIWITGPLARIPVSLDLAVTSNTVSEHFAGKPKHNNKASEADELPEYDDYSPLAYDTAGVRCKYHLINYLLVSAHMLSARTITIIVFDKPNSKPKTSSALLRLPGRFELSFLKIADEIGVNHREPNNIAYDRYCVFTQQWEPEDLKPINMTGRGNYMLYRASSVLEDSCLEIAELKTKVQDSADSGTSSLITCAPIKADDSMQR